MPQLLQQQLAVPVSGAVASAAFPAATAAAAALVAAPPPPPPVPRTPRPTPPLPPVTKSWAKPLDSSVQRWATQQAQAAAAIRAAQGQKLDLVVYGDSLTAFSMAKWGLVRGMPRQRRRGCGPACMHAGKQASVHHARALLADLSPPPLPYPTTTTMQPATWERVMAGLKAIPCGMPGSTVEHLGWRLTSGGEAPAVDPRVVVIFIGKWVGEGEEACDGATASVHARARRRIAPHAPRRPTLLLLLLPGINNVYKRLAPPAPPLDTLVQWMRASMPTTKVIVQGLLPTTKAPSSTLAATNRAYAALAQRHGALYSTCAHELNPRNKQIFNGGAGGGGRRRRGGGCGARRRDVESSAAARCSHHICPLPPTAAPQTACT